MVKANFTTESDDDIEIFDFCGCGKEFSHETDHITKSNTQNSTLNTHSSKGVRMSENEGTLRLTYSGLLTQNGAQDIYAVVGYGSNKNWQNIKYYPMQEVGNKTYELSISNTSTDNINIAFKDGAGHWDNNSGKNYCFNSR